jgi:hypothetical protein
MFEGLGSSGRRLKTKLRRLKAYDIVRIRRKADIDLDDQDSIERGLDSLTLYELKSTRRKAIGPDFDNYFFALTTAELLACVWSD